MMKRILLLAVLSLTVISSYAQTKFTIKGEKKEGTVSLLWTVDSWDEEMEGINIKRRGKSGEWETLNETLIVPYNNLSKDLSNVINSQERLEAVQKLRKEYFENPDGSNIKLKKFSFEELTGVLEGKESPNMLEMMFKFDYDIALMFGFGFVDGTFSDAKKLEYAVFPVKNGEEDTKPAAIFEWNQGDVYDLSIEVVKQKVKKCQKKVTLLWELDQKKLDSNSLIVGFNIYRKPTDGDYIKINPSVIWVNRAGENRTVYFKDEIPNLEVNYTYALVPVSLFKGEGSRYEIVLNTNLPDVTPAPVIITDLPYGYDFKQKGVIIEWKFDSLLNDRLDGFLVERNVFPDSEWQVISDTLNVTNRRFSDNSLKEFPGQKFYYRVIALQNESYPLKSKTLSLYYDPQPEPSMEPDFKANVELENGQPVVYLSWAEDASLFKMINGYRLKSDFGGPVLAGSSGMPVIKEFKYDFTVSGQKGTEYEFAVFYETKNGEVIPYSDTLSVMIPSTDLPFINIWPITVEGSKVTINWKYRDNIADLAGFRVFINNELVADEETITADIRTWTTKELEEGKYEVTIVAVTQFGVESKPSQVRYATVK